jgi:hypothetical protein
MTSDDQLYFSIGRIGHPTAKQNLSGRFTLDQNRFKLGFTIYNTR